MQDLVEHRAAGAARADGRAPTVLLETLVERTEERIALAGTANLTRGGLLDFYGSLRPILEALEEEVCPAAVRRGRGEHHGSASATRTSSRTCGASVVTRVRPRRTVVGGLGVLGPTRMDYPGTIATVRAVARYVGELLAQN